MTGSTTQKSQLVGYVRRTKNGTSLSFSIDVEAFEKASKYQAKDGRQFVSLVANADKVNQIIGGGREVTSLCHLVEEANNEAVKV